MSDKTLTCAGDPFPRLCICARQNGLSQGAGVCVWGGTAGGGGRREEEGRGGRGREVSFFFSLVFFFELVKYVFS